MNNALFPVKTTGNRVHLQVQFVGRRTFLLGQLSFVNLPLAAAVANCSTLDIEYEAVNAPLVAVADTLESLDVDAVLAR